MLLDYDPALLQAAAQDVIAGVKRILMANEHLQTAVRSLSIDWESPAARQSWAAKQTQWDQAEIATHQALQRFGTAVGVSGTTMSETDVRLAGGFG
jgi:uncharacterized protein YukE